MMCSTNVKSHKICAFCKYWYDPTNQYIQPKSPVCNIWKYESTAKCMYLKKNYQIVATSICPKYECKIDY